MSSIIAAMQDSLLLIESSKTGWKIHESLKGSHPQSVTFETRNPNRVYCGTFGDGLWKSDDAGHSWHRLKNVISQSAWQGHYIEHANSLVYRRSIENDGGGEWKVVSNGRICRLIKCSISCSALSYSCLHFAILVSPALSLFVVMVILVESSIFFVQRHRFILCHVFKSTSNNMNSIIIVSYQFAASIAYRTSFFDVGLIQKLTR
jgi:hypothetical protein